MDPPILWMNFSQGYLETSVIQLIENKIHAEIREETQQQ